MSNYLLSSVSPSGKYTRKCQNINACCLASAMMVARKTLSVEEYMINENVLTYRDGTKMVSINIDKFI